MSIDIDSYEDDEDFDDIEDFSPFHDAKKKKKAAAKRRQIREAIELRQLARSLNLSDDDYRSTFY